MKKFKEDLFYSEENQPLLCTRVNGKLTSLNPNVILYSPRVEISGSVVCHLGEVHLGRNGVGSIIEELITQSL
jgi:2-aminoethylphosphonate-pyruvate transaminase